MMLEHVRCLVNIPWICELKVSLMTVVIEEVTSSSSRFESPKALWLLGKDWYPMTSFSKLFSSVHMLSCVWLFSASWTAARQVFLSITSSWSLLKLMSIELAMPSNYLILCHPLLFLHSVFPIIRSFASGGQSIGVSVSASVLPVNIQDWFPLGLIHLISL